MVLHQLHLRNRIRFSVKLYHSFHCSLLCSEVRYFDPSKWSVPFYSWFLVYLQIHLGRARQTYQLQSVLYLTFCLAYDRYTFQAYSVLNWILLCWWNNRNRYQHSFCFRWTPKRRTCIRYDDCSIRPQLFIILDPRQFSIRNRIHPTCKGKCEIRKAWNETNLHGSIRIRWLQKKQRVL